MPPDPIGESPLFNNSFRKAATHSPSKDKIKGREVANKTEELNSMLGIDMNNVDELNDNDDNDSINAFLAQANDAHNEVSRKMTNRSVYRLKILDFRCPYHVFLVQMGSIFSKAL